MQYAFAVPLAILAILAVGMALVFAVVVPKAPAAVAFEGSYHAICFPAKMVVTAHSLEKQKIRLGNITLLEAGAPCSSNVPYLIVGTTAVITCRGKYAPGEPYTLSFDSRVMRVKC